MTRRIVIILVGLGLGLGLSGPGLAWEVIDPVPQMQREWDRMERERHWREEERAWRQQQQWQQQEQFDRLRQWQQDYEQQFQQGVRPPPCFWDRLLQRCM